MHILGVSCYYHDAAAALLRDGQLVAAAEEERFSRVKHDFGFPAHAIRFCLRQAQVDDPVANSIACCSACCRPIPNHGKSFASP